MSTCWSDSIWGEDLPEGKYAPEYYSARGEDCPPILNVDLNEFLEAADRNFGCEYAYHFVDGEWICHQLNYGPDRHMVREIPIPVAA